MSYSQKKNSSRIYVIVGLILVLVLLIAALVYLVQPVPAKPAVPGVKAGDTFTYSIRCHSTLGSDEAVEPDGFSQFNQTDYYKVAITDVEGSVVSFTTTWRFINGTEILNNEWVDLSFGNKTSDNTFWPIYGSNLNKGDKIRPLGADGLTVISVDTKTYAGTSRYRNYWYLQDTFYDTTDETMTSQRIETNSVYFDKETGLLDILTNIQEYNSPSMRLVITWQLTSSSVWKVS
jgi:hypothetical protein